MNDLSAGTKKALNAGLKRAANHATENAAILVEKLLRGKDIPREQVAAAIRLLKIE